MMEWKREPILMEVECIVYKTLEDIIDESKEDRRFTSEDLDDVKDCMMILDYLKGLNVKK